MNENNTFSGAKIIRYNATVGSNGSFEVDDNPRSNIFYAKGFEVAALEIISLALQSEKLEHSVDYLVYPICFNMRHSVELRLKKFWLDLEILSKFRWEKLQAYRNTKLSRDNRLAKNTTEVFPKIKALQLHDIGALWQNISEYAPIIDSRFDNLIDLLSAFIQDIAEIDPTGQTFRYPSDNQSRTHLLDTPLISILILKERFTNLKNAMEFLDELADILIIEYSSCREFDFNKREYKKDTRISHTNKLSYFDVINISYSMSKYTGTDKPYYVEAKESIKSSYNLSNNDYDKIVKILQSDIYINNVIGVENNLLHLDLNSLGKLFELINMHTPFEEYVGFYFNPNDSSTTHEMGYDKIFNNHFSQRENEALCMVLDSFNDKELSEIIALYLFPKGENNYASYLACVSDKIRSFQLISDNLQERRNIVRHYFEKTNFVQFIITSLYLFNFKGIVCDLTSRYGLTSIPWFKRIVSGKYRNAYSIHSYFLQSMELIKSETILTTERIVTLRSVRA